MIKLAVKEKKKKGIVKTEVEVIISEWERNPKISIIALTGDATYFLVYYSGGYALKSMSGRSVLGCYHKNPYDVIKEAYKCFEVEIYSFDGSSRKELTELLNYLDKKEI